MACLEAHHLGRRFPHVNANSEGISMDFSLPCFDSQRVRSQEHRKQISRVSPGCVSARFHTMLEFPNLFYNQERNTTRSASKSNEPCVLQNCSSVRRPRRLSYACEFFKAPVAASWCRNFTQSKGTREFCGQKHITSYLCCISETNPFFSWLRPPFGPAAVGSWDPISSCPRGPLSQRFGRTRPVISVGAFPRLSIGNATLLSGFQWIGLKDISFLYIYISKYYIIITVL